MASKLLLPSRAALFIIVCFFFFSIISFATSSVRDRHYCSCRTSLAGSSGSEHGLFSFMLNKLQCCQGFPVCRPWKTSIYGGEYDLDDYNMVCFGDVSCVRQDAVPGNCNSKSYGCSNHTIVRYKIFNPFGEHSFYTCYSLSKKSNESLCLLPYCDNFQAIQRKCNCDRNDMSCVCYGSAEVSIAEVPPETQVVFLTFSDNFVAQRGKNVFLTVLVATLISLLMVSILVVAFKWMQFPKLLIDDIDDELEYNPLNISNLAAHNPIMASTPNGPDEVNNDDTLPSYEDAINSERDIYNEPPPEYTR